MTNDGYAVVDAERIEAAVATAMGKAAAKTEAFLDSDEPSWQYPKQIRVLDPNQLPTVSVDISRYPAIHGLQDSPNITAEWIIYQDVVKGKLLLDIFYVLITFYILTGSLTELAKNEDRSS